MGESIKKDIAKQPKVEEPKIGVVVDCVRLNVRKQPSTEAEVVTEIPVDTEVKIIDKESTEEFYRVCTTTGVEGFCMKKFIKINK